MRASPPPEGNEEDWVRFLDSGSGDSRRAVDGSAAVAKLAIATESRAQVAALKPAIAGI